LHGRRQRHRRQAGRGDSGQQPRQHGEDERLASRRQAGIAVVQQQDIAGTEAAGQALENAPPVAGPRIVGTAGPRGESQVEAGENRVEQRIAQAGRRGKNWGAWPVTSLSVVWAAAMSARIRVRPKVANIQECESP